MERTNLATDNAPNVATVINRIDWYDLQHQKFALLSLTHDRANRQVSEKLDAVIHFIDSLQDAVVDDGLVPEAIVFGEYVE